MTSRHRSTCHRTDVGLLRRGIIPWGGTRRRRELGCRERKLECRDHDTRFHERELRFGERVLGCRERELLVRHPAAFSEVFFYLDLKYLYFTISDDKNLLL